MTLSAWFTVILERAGLPPMQAALTFSFAAMGAIVGDHCARPADGPVRAQGRRCSRPSSRSSSIYLSRHAGARALVDHRDGHPRLRLGRGHPPVAERHGRRLLPHHHPRQRGRLRHRNGPGCRHFRAGLCRHPVRAIAAPAGSGIHRRARPGGGGGLYRPGPPAQNPAGRGDRNVPMPEKLPA